jgi:hypothetical protein
MKPIADARFFTRQHLEKYRGNAPADLAELAVRSLELVAELAACGLQFRFKGGNSLLVLLGDPRRFSIDVDISTNEPKERIDECVEACVRKYGVFSRWQRRQHKTKPWLPMTSYEIYFPSQVLSGPEPFLMLDAVLHSVPYPEVEKKVACGELYQSNVLCRLPAISSLLGDKLLTLGPSTLGIPLFKKKEAQRLKHVHDVSLLAEKGAFLKDLRESVRLCVEEENRIQEKAVTLKQIFDDTIAFLRLPLLFAERPASSGGNDMLGEILFGIDPFAKHLFSSLYSWERLQFDSARASLCLSAMFVETVGEGAFQKALDDAARKGARYCWSQIAQWSGNDYLQP